VISYSIAPAQRYFDRVFGFVLLRHGSLENHRVAGIVGSAEPDIDPAEEGLRTRPIRHESSDESVGGQDVHEDLRRSALLGEDVIVMDVLVVARSDCCTDDQLARQRNFEFRERFANIDRLESAGLMISGRQDAMSSSATP
jgi:hypothetical protein